MQQHAILARTIEHEFDPAHGLANISLVLHGGKPTLAFVGQGDVLFAYSGRVLELASAKTSKSCNVLPLGQVAGLDLCLDGTSYTNPRRSDLSVPWLITALDSAQGLRGSKKQSASADPPVASFKLDFVEVPIEFSHISIMEADDGLEHSLEQKAVAFHAPVLRRLPNAWSLVKSGQPLKREVHEQWDRVDMAFGKDPNPAKKRRKGFA